MNEVLIENDLRQREQAINIQESFIIQAPAGSGKTELLIQRLLALLAHVNSPEEILAITFTKKAANEMRERVVNALKEATHQDEPESPHKRKTWRLAKSVLQRDQQVQWQLMANPNRLQIKTIDSLCSYLTGQLPLLAQFGSQPTIAESADYLYEETAQQVLMQIESDAVWSESISELLLHLDNDLNQLKALLVRLLAKRDQWLPHIFTHGDDILDTLEQQIERIMQDAIVTAEVLFPKECYVEALQLLQYAESNLGRSQNRSGLHWQQLSSLLLTKDYTWRKTVDARNGFPAASSTKNPAETLPFKENKKRMTQLLADLALNEDLRLALENIARLPEPGLQKLESGILEYLIPVLKLAAAQLRITFQLHGKIDFIENALAALTALGNNSHPTDLALALDYKIQHILIDEFQDTSSTQYKLLKKLTYGWQTGDGRTLFVVGDPMQSIYRFREAEVGLFLRMREFGIGSINLNSLTLSLNFRSMPAIVDWNNKHFSAIFPQYTNAATGAVSYSESMTQKRDEDVEVEVRGFDVASLDTKNVFRLQSEYIANKIKNWQQTYPTDTIAILVRSRSHLKKVISTLRDHSITYQAIEIDPLSTRQHIIDLLSLTNALLHLADRIAWLSVLRAPWCGLTLSDLLIITGDTKKDAIWERLTQQQVLEQLSSESQSRIKRILPILERAINLRGRCALREWIESTWVLLGGSACLNNESELTDANTFFETLTTLDNDGRYFSSEQLKEKISKAYAAAEQLANVQIMTVHAAKGLEFDSVILPHLEKSLPADDKSLLVWMEHTLQNNETTLLLAPLKSTEAKQHATYNYIRWQQKIKAQFETDRLFYVAATRAKKRLCLYYDVQAKLSGDSFLKKLQSFIGEVTKDQTSTRNSTLLTPKQTLTRLTVNWQNPFLVPKKSKPAIHNTFTGFLLGTDTPRKIGITIHTILQQITNRSDKWWQELKQEQQLQLSNNLLVRQNLFQNEVRAAVNTVIAAINNTIKDSRGQWILHSHQDAHAEYAITACINDEFKNYVIDRTFIDESGFRWIIDYKTSQPGEGVSIEDFLAKEKETYAEKMQQYADIMRLQGDENIKLGLYFPLIQKWIEW